tara:strand:+ start:299 stop:508 length:210 start_codon:yes stop_codon:yes gene_type:complete
MYIVRYTSKEDKNKVIEYLQTHSISKANHAESVISKCSDVHSVWIVESRSYPGKLNIPKDYDGRNYDPT